MPPANRPVSSLATSSSLTSSAQTLERRAAVAVSSALAPQTASTPSFTASQAAVFRAFVEAFVAPLNASETEELVTLAAADTASADSVRRFASSPPSAFPGAEEALPFLMSVARPQEIAAIGMFLSVISTTAGCFAFTGYRKPFTELDRRERAAAIKTMSTSSIAPVRMLIGALHACIGMCIHGVPTEMEDGVRTHPLWTAIGYHGHPSFDRPLPKSEEIWRPSFEDVFSSLAPETEASDAVLTCDVVIVGSGAGAGVVAAEMTKQGYDVIVLEKAIYQHPTDLPYSEKAAFEALYEQSASLMTENGAIRILAGSTFGGGTAINWSASLRMPAKTREEWAQKYGLPYFVSPAYNDVLDSVCTRSGVGTAGIRHNRPNQLLAEGMRRLGQPYSDIPQNTASKTHDCGFCWSTCPYGEKQGTSQTFLRDAAETGRCRFVQGCKVDLILQHAGRASGVSATVVDVNAGHRSRKLVVKAKRVVVSAGSLHTPALLLRSGFKNRNVGRHLRLHPVTFAFGIFTDEVEPIKPWSGSIMTILGNQAADAHGDGHGAIVEIPPLHPAFFAALLPFRDAITHKRHLVQLPRTVPCVVICRDSDASTGRVTLPKTADEAPAITYDFGAKDQRSLFAGVEVAFRALIAAGATEIYTVQGGVPPFRVPKTTTDNVLASPEFAAYLDQVRAWGYKPNWQPIGTAHQVRRCFVLRSEVQPSATSFVHWTNLLSSLFRIRWAAVGFPLILERVLATRMEGPGTSLVATLPMRASSLPLAA
ncbi:hypothetical protein HKX48_000919 [Thoreauomyces humboldtii]|nr:hypothetical protein HKX48_000919 [Thoreauomyces humboldtii]